MLDWEPVALLDQLALHFLWQGVQQLIVRHQDATHTGAAVCVLTSVLTAPGQTTFTRMGDKSIAKPRASASTEPAVLMISAQVGGGLRTPVPVRRGESPSKGLRKERCTYGECDRSTLSKFDLLGRSCRAPES